MAFLFDGAYFELAGHKIWEKSVEDIIWSFQRPCLNSLGGFGRQLEKPIKASQMSWRGGRQARKGEAEIRKQVFGYRGLYRHSPGGWWAPLVPGGTSSLPQKPPSGLHPPPAVGSTPDTNGTQWGAESVRVPLRAGAKGWDQCVCQTLPPHTVHDTPFLLWCIYLVSGWYGRRSGKAGVPI